MSQLFLLPCSALLFDEKSVPTEAPLDGSNVGLVAHPLTLGPALHPQLNTQLQTVSGKALTTSQAAASMPTTFLHANSLPSSGTGDNENSTYVVLKPQSGSFTHVRTISSENQVSSTCEHDEFQEQGEGNIAQESDNQHSAESLVSARLHRSLSGSEVSVMQQAFEAETSGVESALESKTNMSSNDVHSKIHKLESTLIKQQVVIDKLQRQCLELSHSHQHLLYEFAEKYKTVEPCSCRQFQKTSSRRVVDQTVLEEKINTLKARDYDRLEAAHDRLQDENTRLSEKLVSMEAKMIALLSCKLETIHQAQCPK